MDDFNLNDHLTGDRQLDDKVTEWLSWDKNNRTLESIKDLLLRKQTDKLRELLLHRLTFGTAGIRGKMMAGYSAMNDLVLIQTSQGLASYLLKIDPNVKKNGVIIGYDARHNSHRFAQRTAVAFLQKDIPVYLYSKIVPTPFIPFGIKVLKCSAGVVVTASHNPKDDNGYKVYFSNGAQIISPHDQGIQSQIEANLEPWSAAWNLALLEKCTDPWQLVYTSYFNALSDIVLDSTMLTESDLRITYTSLHGVGHNYVTAAFKLCGFKHYFPVLEQKDPDPEFSTVTFPNPEEGKGVLDLSIKTATATNSTLILANDPDTDRCAVAEMQSDGSWKLFTGDEVGALLGWWCWFKQQTKFPDIPKSDCYMLASAVSSKVLQTMAKHEGFNFIETLTGFKWMGNRADLLIQQGKTVLLAYEEAIGYMCGSQVLDKDGITAAMEVAQLTVYLRSKENCNLSEHLSNLYNKYGYHCSINSYYLCYDQLLIKRIFSGISNYNGTNTYPTEIGSYKIIRVRDLNSGYDSGTTDKKAELPSSSSSFMLTFYFDNGVIFTVRTSGTEPKVKYYSEAIASPTNKNWPAVKQMLRDVVTSIINNCLEPEKNGLLPRVE